MIGISTFFKNHSNAIFKDISIILCRVRGVF